MPMLDIKENDYFIVSNFGLELCVAGKVSEWRVSLPNSRRWVSRSSIVAVGTFDEMNERIKLGRQLIRQQQRESTSLHIKHKVEREAVFSGQPLPVDPALDLIDKVVRLNPEAGEIGPGMLSNLVELARRIQSKE
jgi:hypothetical protein